MSTIERLKRATALGLGGALLAGAALVAMPMALGTPAALGADPASSFYYESDIGDGILMVVRARRTRESSFLRALSSLTSCPILGTVYNDEVG